MTSLPEGGTDDRSPTFLHQAYFMLTTILLSFKTNSNEIIRTPAAARPALPLLHRPQHRGVQNETAAAPQRLQQPHDRSPASPVTVVVGGGEEGGGSASKAAGRRAENRHRAPVVIHGVHGV